jgi:hypothetical protein
MLPSGIKAWSKKKGVTRSILWIYMDIYSKDITTFLDEFEKYNYDKDNEHFEMECTHEKDSYLEIKKNQDECIPKKGHENEDGEKENKPHACNQLKEDQQVKDHLFQQQVDQDDAQIERENTNRKIQGGFKYEEHAQN